jgi:acetolactate decarboxylase
MPKIATEIPQTLFNALSKYLNQHSSQSLDDVVSHALKMYLEANSDILYQVSTSAALVEGVYRGAITVGALLEHGDLGLGTFEDLDGEMIVLDGEVFQARADGSVERVNADVKTPFAVVTQFTPTERLVDVICPSYEHLERELDRMRASENLFYALRITGVFDQVHVRAMCKTEEGVPLVRAAAVQPEFHYEQIAGTLVGFWSPQYAKALNVPGYHLHFLSKEHLKGGHLLGCAGRNLRLELQREIGLTAVLPENQEFLQADLTHDPAADLNKAERPQDRSDS